MSPNELLRTDHTLSYPNEPTRVIRLRCTRPAAQSGELPSVVVLHGFKGFLRWGFFPEWQDRLARAGYLSVALNLSGSGVGPDLEHFDEDQAFFDSTPSRDLEDLERVLEALRSGALPGADLGRLGIMGHSRGGGSALLHAERTGAYRALVTWASVAHSNRFDEETLERWRAEGVLEVPNARIGRAHRMGLCWLEDVETHAEELDILAACGRLETPSLLIHGDQDQAVSIGDMSLLQCAFSPGLARSVTIPGAGHTFGCVHPWKGSTPQLEQAIEASLEFLAAELD